MKMGERGVVLIAKPSLSKPSMITGHSSARGFELMGDYQSHLKARIATVDTISPVSGQA